MVPLPPQSYRLSPVSMQCNLLLMFLASRVLSCLILVMKPVSSMLALPSIMAVWRAGLVPTGRMVSMADGTPILVYGSVPVTLTFPREKPNDLSTVSVRGTCHLLSLGGQWQCILGDDFMRSHRAFLQFEPQGARVLLYQPNTQIPLCLLRTAVPVG